MFVVTRKVGQSVVIGDEIEVVILEIRGELTRVGVKSPKGMLVRRKENVLTLESLFPPSDSERPD